jgi:2-methylaconitate cis-trans-isomerase PrpF
VLHRDALPLQGSLRDAVILSIFGSPDRRQIDGIGGAEPLTSKVAIVSRSTRPDADVDYTFGQVGIEDASINYAVTCGNMVAAVGPFAIDEGIVPAQEPLTRVRIYNTNTSKIILADVPVLQGRARCDGDCVIDGVPGSGAGIRLTFLQPAGAITGRLLPTGQAREVLQSEHGPVLVSLVDSGTLYAFIPAAHFGLSGDETAATVERWPELMDAVAAVRRAAAIRLMDCGAVDETLGRRLATTLKVALVGPGDGAGIDLHARIVNPERVHKAFAVTGAVALGSAACVAGSVIGDLLPTRGSGRLVIGHPSGRIGVEMTVSSESGRLAIEGAMVERTARRIMDGHIYLHHGVLGRLEASRGGEQASVEPRLVGEA